MPRVRCVLVDETSFVFLTRDEKDFPLKVELARFLEKCNKNNANREYRVYSTRVVKKRLGCGWMYNAIRSILTQNAKKRAMFQKRLQRRGLARNVIVRFLRRRSFRGKPVNWALMDLHLFANENKSAALKRNLTPDEVISLDLCTNALIAHQTGYPLFSFNEDYQYFLLMPAGKKSYMQYWKPDDVLHTMHI